MILAMLAIIQGGGQNTFKFKIHDVQNILVLVRMRERGQRTLKYKVLLREEAENTRSHGSHWEVPETVRMGHHSHTRCMCGSFPPPQNNAFSSFPHPLLLYFYCLLFVFHFILASMRASIRDWSLSHFEKIYIDNVLYLRNLSPQRKKKTVYTLTCEVDWDYFDTQKLVCQRT